jgi:putative membrane protein
MRAQNDQESDPAELTLDPRRKEIHVNHLLAAASDVTTTEIQRPMFPWPAPTLGHALLYVLLFGILGIVLTAFGFKVFDWIMPKIHVETELAEKHNMAVAVVMAAVIVGISLVVGAAVMG